MAGRIATLLAEADREVSARINPVTGDISLDDSADPRVDDILDDRSEWVLANGGQVVIVPSERMSSITGAAAVYRF